MAVWGPPVGSREKAPPPPPHPRRRAMQTVEGGPLRCEARGTGLQSNNFRTKTASVTVPWAPFMKEKQTLRKRPPPLALGGRGLHSKANGGPDGQTPHPRASRDDAGPSDWVAAPVRLRRPPPHVRADVWSSRVRADVWSSRALPVRRPHWHGPVCPGPGPHLCRPPPPPGRANFTCGL